MVQLHMKIGTLDMVKHIKEIILLGEHLIRAGHAAYV